MFIVKRILKARRFRGELDLAARLYGIPTDLQEILNLKRRSYAIVSGKDKGWDPWVYLEGLNPYAFVSREDDVLIIEHHSYRLIEPWSVARFHIPRLDAQLLEVVADKCGVHLLDAEQQEIVRFPDVCIDPDDYPAPSQRHYTEACWIILAFTRLELDPDYHWGRTSRIAVRRIGDRWYAECAPMTHSR